MDELVGPGPGELLVETVASAISVGSEMPIVRGIARSSTPIYYPVMTGYESLGIVRETGDGVSGFDAGDRVVGFYGHRSAACVRAANAIPVPAEISDEIALLAILTCDVAKGIAKVSPLAEEQIVVAGAGAIGLLTIWMLQQRGIAQITVIEPLETRRDLARFLGCERTLDSGEGSAIGAIAQVGFECSSTAGGFESLQRVMVPGGRMCVLSDGNVMPLMLDPVFHERELSVVGSSDGLDYQRHAQWFFSPERSPRSELARLFDLTIAAAQLEATFLDMCEDRICPIKVLVRHD